MSLYDVVYDHDLYPGDLVALEFVKAALALEGDATYGDAEAVGQFVEATDAALSVMLSQAQAFWTGGADDTVGWSAAAPYEYFDCFISDSGGGTGEWQYATTVGGASTITGRNYALGLRGWYAVNGYDSTASGVYRWLIAATSNAAFETLADTPPAVVYATTTGTYDPRLALATYIDAPRNRNASALYDWATVGLLGPLRAANGFDLTESKRQASRLRQQDYAGVLSAKFHRVSLRGKSGLTYQVAFTETVEGSSRRVYDATAAAMVGLVYREAPVIFIQRDHPE